MIVRRCSERRFFTKPSKLGNQAIEYCLAAAAKKAGVKILWSVFMSNHHHTGIYDPDARLPVFAHELHRLIAKHHNKMYGRQDHFWESGQSTYVRLHDSQAVLDALVYSLANPVAAHLVDRAQHWPGVRTLPHQLCTTRQVSRPRFYFRQNGCMPKTLPLELHLPPCFQHLSPGEFRKLVSDALRKREHELREKRTAQGRSLLGRGEILSESHLDSPRSRPTKKKSNASTKAHNPWERVTALKKLREFEKQYAEALQRFRTGERKAVFPFGTYLMRVLFGVECEPPPTETGNSSMSYA